MKPVLPGSFDWLKCLNTCLTRNTWALSFLPQELPRLFAQRQDTLTTKTMADHLLSSVPHTSYSKAPHQKGKSP